MHRFTEPLESRRLMSGAAMSASQNQTGSTSVPIEVAGTYSGTIVAGSRSLHFSLTISSTDSKGHASGSLTLDTLKNGTITVGAYGAASRSGVFEMKFSPIPIDPGVPYKISGEIDGKHDLNSTSKFSGSATLVERGLVNPFSHTHLPSVRTSGHFKSVARA